VSYPNLSNLLSKEWKQMKSKSSFAAAMVFLIPALTFAGAKNSANLKLDQSVTVAGSQLAPGQYKLTWEGSGPDVTVKFAEGKNVVATAPAKLVNTSTNQEAIETDTVADSTRLLRAVDLKKVMIQFANAAPGGGN
jgi:hypothetical protein